MSPKDSQKTLCLLMRLGTMTGRDGVTDPVTDDARIGECHRLRLEHGVSLTCHWRYWGCDPMRWT